MIPNLLPDTDPMLHVAIAAFDFSAPDALPTALAVANTLKEAMRHYNGVGLAANQVGIDIRACVVDLHPLPLVLFNPLVTWLSAETKLIEEGCLTFPDIWLKISRPRECQIAYDDEQGHRRVLDLTGMEARIALHEVDHLDGLTFTDRVSRLKLSMARKKMQKKA
jgi:peptide deformylase